jgi:hypothetical protein
MSHSYPSASLNEPRLKMMKIVLLLIIICILIGISLQGKVIRVQIVIPPALLPYYEWLRSFPGVKQNPESPLKEDHSPYKSYQI